MDYDYFMNASAETQMELVNMMLQMENIAELTEQAPSSEFSTPSPPASYYDSPTSPASPLIPVGPQTSSSSNNCTPFLEPLMFSVPTQTTSSELAFGASIFSGNPSSEAAMREMIFRIAAMQPVQIDPESVKPPKRRNVRISKDPQSVAARHRREKISERIRILQRMVPGGTKMDTASMLDEAIHYVKFLKAQVQSLELAAVAAAGQVTGFRASVSSYPLADGCMSGSGGYSFYEDMHHVLQDQGAFRNCSTDLWN